MGLVGIRTVTVFSLILEGKIFLFLSPQLPCFAFQVRAELELVSAISFHELLDVAIVFENKQTKQLEAMSAVRMGFQVSTSLIFPLLILSVLQARANQGSYLVRSYPCSGDLNNELVNSRNIFPWELHSCFSPILT